MFKNLDLNQVISHNSARSKYRTPLGALKTGESVKLRLFVKEISLEKVFLTVINGIYKEDLEMYRIDSGFECEYCLPEKEVVLWYFFTIVSGNTRIYYGRNYEQTSGTGKIYWDAPPAFQLTVYNADFSVPEWFKGATMYQIFPDRFCVGDKNNKEKGKIYHESKKRRVILHENSEEPVIYEPVGGAQYYEPCDYYGGDLKGIENSLPYFKDMGVSVLYLNPIFEAASNHRYNTSDYLKVDPLLGTNEDFINLCKKAEEQGIKIMLDGVFSHTGDDSIYFNKYGNYEEKGAYQGEESPYYKWYDFKNFPDEYRCWWGFTTLPEVNEHEKEWEDFVINGENSVMRSWIKNGAAGFRLDVADELPDDTIRKMRTAIKKENKNSVLLGEVWEDATIKQSYGNVRTYALGRGLDSVMNYPFRNAVIDFIMFRSNAYNLKNFLVAQSQNYPCDMYNSLMNLLSSHDVERVHTILSTTYQVTELSREQQAHIAISDEFAARGKELQKIAAALQFTVPGVPCIYYGDENSMDGLKDPFNRGFFKEQNEDMREFYKQISNIRKRSTALKEGGYAFYACGDDVAAVLRFKEGCREDVTEEIYLTVVNRSDEERSFAVDIFAETECLSAEQIEMLRRKKTKSAVCCFTGRTFGAYNGIIGGSIMPRQACLIKIS